MPFLQHFLSLIAQTNSVAQAYLNQKRLDAEAKQLHASANNFSRQTYLWMSQIDAFSNALKVRNAFPHTMSSTY